MHEKKAYAQELAATILGAGLTGATALVLVRRGMTTYDELIDISSAVAREILPEVEMRMRAHLSNQAWHDDVKVIMAQVRAELEVRKKLWRHMVETASGKVLEDN